MERLSITRNQLAGEKPAEHKPRVGSHVGPSRIKLVDSAVEYYKFYESLDPEIQQLAKRVRDLAEKEIKPLCSEHYEKATFPEEVIPILAKSGLAAVCLEKPYGEGKPITHMMVIIFELARVDASIATFFLVQTGLAMATIESLGSKEQKDRYLPDMRDMKKISGWGLTEFDIGSDAGNLGTVANKVEGGYKIKGNKRWIGNGNRDYVVCWARNSESKNIQAFVVDMKSPNVRSEPIKNKLSLRIVQNCQIYFDDVFVPDEDRLALAKDFTSTGIILLQSRIKVCAVATGIAIGIYDNAVKYLNTRKQFGVKLTSFQLVQDKIVRMMGNVQAMILMTSRMFQLYEEKKATIGMIGMAKAWCTKTGREVAALGREVLGGNGIIHDNYVMKGFADMEAIHTYEGTFDINTLVAGRELTGVSAFKAK